MTTSKKNTAILQMVICASLWSIAGLFMKFIPWHPFAVAGMRSLFAAVTVAVYMIVTKCRFIISKKVILSMIFLCATFLAFSSANKLTTAANAIVLQFTSPVFILIFELIMKRRRIHRSDILCVIITLMGIVLFVADSLDAGGLWGNIIGLVSGITMAGMFICVGETPSDEKMSGIFMGHIATAAIGVPFLFITGGEITGRSMLFIIILGVVQLGIPYILYALSTNACPPLAVCLISAIEPLLNPVWVAIFYGERPTVKSILGGVIVICAVTAYCILDRKHEAGSAV